MANDKSKDNLPAGTSTSPFLEIATGESLASVRKAHEKANLQRRMLAFIGLLSLVGVYYGIELMKSAAKIQREENKKQIRKNVENSTELRNSSIDADQKDAE